MYTADMAFPSVLIVLAVLTISAADGLSLMDMIKFCKANDPNLNGCVKDAANAFIPQMAKGLEDIGIPSLDPLFTPVLELVEETQYVSIDLKYTDVTQTGLSKMIVDDAVIDLAKGVWNFKLTQPFFMAVGNHDSKGTVLNVGINGKGAFNSTHLNTKIEIAIEVSREKRGDDEYFKLEKFNIYYTFGTAMMEYEGLFNGDEKMAKETNDFLNEHSHEILTDLKPALEQVYTDLFRGYLKSFLDNVPATTLFPKA